MDKNDCVPLVGLLNAPKKAFVVFIFQEAFRYRHTHVPTAVVKKVAETLKVEEDDATALFKSVKKIIGEALFESLGPSEIAALFPKKFHKDLKELISAVVSDGLPKWREESNLCMVSLPKLEDFDWRVDIKSSANSLSRMSLPSVIVQMKIRDTPVVADEMAPLQPVKFELSRETLDTMLDGLTKIRDQLSSVAVAQ